ncbi:MAG: glycosyltransferase family 4 protein [Aquihabitans sp.]
MSVADQPLRVVFLTSEFPPLPHGGIGVFVEGMTRGLVQAGHEAVVIGVTPHIADRTEEDQAGVRVIRVPEGRLRSVGAFDAALAVRREVAPWLDHPRAVIEGSELSLWALPQPWMDKSIARLHGGHRFFADAEGRKPKVLRAAIEKRSLRRAGHLVGVSRYVLDRTTELVGLTPRSVRVIYNGVDETLFRPQDDQEADEDLVVFVGTLCEKKGLRHLVRAIDLLRQEGRSVRLRVAGRDAGAPDGSGSFLDHVLAEVPVATRSRIEYVGSVDHREMPEIYGAAAVVALPSLMEAQGIAWVEAMACGRPLVGSTAGPGPEVVDDGRSGLLRSPTDPAAIADGIRTVLTDPVLAAELGAAARQVVCRRFTLDEATESNIGLYRDVVDDARV